MTSIWGAYVHIHGRKPTAKRYQPCRLYDNPVPHYHTYDCADDCADDCSTCCEDDPRGPSYRDARSLVGSVVLGVMIFAVLLTIATLTGALWQ